jgi:hypothetical protein
MVGVPDKAHICPYRLGWQSLAWEQWLLMGVLMLAAACRLSGLDLGWFMLDQVRDAMEATRIALGENLPLVGPIAPGLYVLGPLYYYLLAVPFGLSQDPTVAIFFISVLNLVSVYLSYRLGKEFFSGTVGLVAAALYAVFPMATISTKSLWNPGFIPFFTIVFFYGLFRFLVAGRPWGLTLALVALGCLLQVHLSGLALLLLLGLALVLFRPSLPWRQALVGCILVLGLFSSYLVFEANRGFQGVSDALRFTRAHGGPEGSRFGVDLLWRAVQTPFTLPAQMGRALPSSLRFHVFEFIQSLELILFVCGLLWVLYRALRYWPQRKGPPRNYGLLLLWIVIPVLTLTQKKEAVFWYYFDLLYPSQFLVIGIFVDGLLLALTRQQMARRWLWASRGAIALLIGVIVLAQASFVAAVQRYVSNSGFMPLPTDISLRFPDSAWLIREPGTVRLMPLRYKRDLTALLLADSPMDEATFHRHVHGATFEDLLDDKGYFFEAFQRPGLHENTEVHYMIARKQDWPGTLQGSWKRVGPFEVLRYESAVQYATWKYTREPGPRWFTRDYDDTTWEGRRLPARNLPDRAAYAQTPFAYWGKFPIYCRGWLRVEKDVEQLHLVVSLRDSPLAEHRHDLTAFYVNGQPLQPVHTHSYLTFLARSTEVIFDVAPVLTPGLNLVAFEVAGLFHGFDLDVYDVRWRREDAR